MGVGIVAICVVDGNVGAHPVRNEIILYKLTHKSDPLAFAQLHGQCHDELTGKLTVLGFLVGLDSVPERFPVLPCGGSHWRQKTCSQTSPPLRV